MNWESTFYFLTYFAWLFDCAKFVRPRVTLGFIDFVHVVQKILEIVLWILSQTLSAFNHFVTDINQKDERQTEDYSLRCRLCLCAHRLSNFYM